MNKTIQELSGDVIFDIVQDHISDMEIQSGVDYLIISQNIKMKSSRKSFPDVKQLIINDNVSIINIPNTLFPNVKRIESSSEYFENGKNLIYKEKIKFGGEYRVLYNTFCKQEGEVIDLAGVSRLQDNAFYKCNSTNIINLQIKGNYYSQNVNVFKDSACLKKPFVNNLQTVGNIILDVKTDVDEITVPDDENLPYIFIEDIELSKIQKLIIHNIETIIKLPHWNQLPQTILLDTTKEPNVYELQCLAHKLGYHNTSIKHLSLSRNVPGLKEIDGVIYTEDITTLIVCPIDIDKESVVIPEGVTNIIEDAFDRCNIKTVVLPNSLKRIGEHAFSNCKNLESVSFGTGIEVINEGSFYNCPTLKQINIPCNIKVIKSRAFLQTGLESVILNEGLETIGTNAFDDTNLTEIVIPQSVTTLNYNCFGRKIKRITTKTCNNITLISSLTRPCRPSNSSFYGKDDSIEILYRDKKVYVPRYIKPNVKLYFDRMFHDITQVYDTWDYAYTKETKENIAIYESIDEPEKISEIRQTYLKKNSKRIVLRLIENGDEKQTVDFLKLGLVSKVTLKQLVELANEKGQAIVQSYILKQLKETGISAGNFYL